MVFGFGFGSGCGVRSGTTRIRYAYEASYEPRILNPDIMIFYSCKLDSDIIFFSTLEQNIVSGYELERTSKSEVLLKTILKTPKRQKEIAARDGIRTRASEEIAALTRRLRPTRPPAL